MRKNERVLDDCPVCGSKHSISWDSDYAYGDIGMEGNGLVSQLHCIVCETEIELRIPFKEESEGAENA